jgi:hypothetical protein
MTFRISNPSIEGVYQASKWIKFHVLCDAQELAALFEKLSPFFIIRLTGVHDGRLIDEKTFLNTYDGWIQKLKQGEAPTEASLKQMLAAAWTNDLEALWLQQVSVDKYITKPAKPFIRVQPHFFTYSSLDHVFRPMSVGMNSHFWGLEIAYPQVYQDPKTMELLTLQETEWFSRIRIWIRDVTKPVSFLVDGQKITTTMRLGKNCFSWAELKGADGISIIR